MTVIVFNLCCDNEHLFEGWFASAEAFEDQGRRQLVVCPICGSPHVRRLPSAPYVNTGARAEPKNLPEAAGVSGATGSSQQPVSREVLAAVMTMLRRAGRESEDVGERFPDEARRIYHGESERRGIKGQASSEELEQLLEEGIPVLPLLADEDELH